MSRPHNRRGSHGRRRDHRQGAPQGDWRREAPVPLTAEGVPASTPNAPRPSPVVHVSKESRARYPWLPARVIAGSVWRGPANERVRIDERGDAIPAVGARSA